MADLITSTAAAKLLGVRPTTIKRWADSGELPCVKTAGGHRRFDRSLLERRMRQEHRSRADDRFGAWIAELIEGGDPLLAHARLLAARARLGAWHRVAAELGELLRELGERWARGELSVIEEHVASAALSRALAAASSSIPVAPDAPRCLLACAENDQHTLGLALAELCLREAGWRTEWGGSRTRTADVVERVADGSLRMVALSASIASADPKPLERAALAIEAECRAKRVAVALGGDGAWPEAPAYAVRFRGLESFYRHADEQKDVAR